MPLPTLATLSPHGLLILAGASIIGLILLIARFRCNAFVALILASLSVGIGSGMPLADVATTFDAGVGKTLGGLAMIIGLGTILGKMLSESGAAHVIANLLHRKSRAAKQAAPASNATVSTRFQDGIQVTLAFTGTR